MTAISTNIQPQVVAKYIPLRKRSLFTIIPLTICLLFYCWNFVPLWNLQHTVFDFDTQWTEGTITPILNGFFLIQIGIATMSLLGELVAGIGFILWMRQANRNLPALGSCELKYRPTDIPWAFLIPIVALYKPFLIMSEIWKASNLGNKLGVTWKNRKTSFLVISWWICWLVMCGMNRVTGSVSDRLSSLHDPIAIMQCLRTYLATMYFDLGVAILAGVLAIAVVLKLTDIQQKKHTVVILDESAARYQAYLPRMGIIYNLRQFLSSVLRFSGWTAFIILGIWSLRLCFSIVEQAMGWGWAMFSLLFFPALITLAPWYALFAHHEWFPLGLTYGGGILGNILLILAGIAEPKQKMDTH